MPLVHHLVQALPFVQSIQFLQLVQCHHFVHQYQLLLVHQALQWRHDHQYLQLGLVVPGSQLNRGNLGDQLVQRVQLLHELHRYHPCHRYPIRQDKTRQESS